MSCFLNSLQTVELVLVLTYIHLTVVHPSVSAKEQKDRLPLNHIAGKRRMSAVCVPVRMCPITCAIHGWIVTVVNLVIGPASVWCQLMEEPSNWISLQTLIVWWLVVRRNEIYLFWGKMRCAVGNRSYTATISYIFNSCVLRKNMESHLEDPEMLLVIFNNLIFYRGWDILILSQGWS